MQRNEQYVFIIENQYYSSATILQLVYQNENYYKQLISHNCIRYNDFGQAAFAFVGVITLEDLIICVFPKYHKLSSEPLTIKDFVKIVKVLKKAGTINFITPDFKTFSPFVDSYSSELVIADAIIKDFLDKGIFRKELAISEFNVFGEIDWQKTVDLTSPFFSNGKPIYHENIVNLQSIDGYNIITELHRWAIGHLLKKYGQILDYHFSYSEDVAKNLSEIGTKRYLITLLQQELMHSFIDRNIRLMKLLLALIRKKFDNQEDGLSIYGTSYFYTIWEKVCSSAFSNQIDSLKSIISKPEWNDLKGNSISKDTLRPDIVLLLDDEQEVLFILDAKYYNFRFSSQPRFDVIGYPGLGDISKQYLYELAFETKGFHTIINMLLFPSLDYETVNISGFINFDLFPQRKLWLSYVNVNVAYDYYLTGQKYSKVILKEIRDTVNSKCRNALA